MVFRKILIANRGEIAIRVIRACRDLGIVPVAVYSEPDANALHVRLADEAVCIGPAPSVQSYLNIEAIVSAATQTGAEAIHPGYGFLAENADFARALVAAGMKFIGPPAAAMEIMGAKTSARQAAIEARVAIVPGTVTPLKSLTEAEKVAVEFGYPVMLKASAGGGGKGMRLVASAEELQSAFDNAASEAAAAFGDSALYLEKVVERSRHIEIQVFADTHGNVVHLGERECSIQRRHQKVIEECPSPIDDPELRERMGQAAIKIARAVSYAESLQATDTRAVSFVIEPGAAEAIQQQWYEQGFDVPLDLVEAPFRELREPMLEEVHRHLREEDTVVAVVMPELLAAHWWQAPLHNQTALLVKRALLFEPRVILSSVPYQLR